MNHKLRAAKFAQIKILQYMIKWHFATEIHLDIKLEKVPKRVKSFCSHFMRIYS